MNNTVYKSAEINKFQRIYFNFENDEKIIGNMEIFCLYVNNEKGGLERKKSESISFYLNEDGKMEIKFVPSSGNSKTNGNKIKKEILDFFNGNDYMRNEIERILRILNEVKSNLFDLGKYNTKIEEDFFGGDEIKVNCENEDVCFSYNLYDFDDVPFLDNIRIKGSFEIKYDIGLGVLSRRLYANSEQRKLFFNSPKIRLKKLLSETN